MRTPGIGPLYTWHRSLGCGPDEPMLRGVCFHCGAEEPEPIEDFGNGYNTELSGFQAYESLDWRDRANATGWPGIKRFLDRLYAGSERYQDRLHYASTKASPLMRAFCR